VHQVVECSNPGSCLQVLLIKSHLTQVMMFAILGVQGSYSLIELSLVDSVIIIIIHAKNKSIALTCCGRQISFFKSFIKFFT
jgi:hypothetical protein